MSGQSRQKLAALVVLGLTCRFFYEEPTLGDARLFALGRLHLWPDWPHLGQKERAWVTRFLGQRPEGLAEQRLLRTALVQVLRKKDEFRCVDEQAGLLEEAKTWGLRFEPVPGRALDQRLEEWLAALEAGVSRGIPVADNQTMKDCIDLETMDGMVFRVPLDEVPKPAADWAAPEPVGIDKWCLNIPRLEALAERVDGAGAGGVRYGKTLSRDFLPRLTRPGGGDAPDPIKAGETRLLVAPTGSGKSVFMRLQALDLVARGIQVALVVPDIATAWKETLRLEDAAERAGLSPKVAPLTGWRDVPKHLAAHIGRPPEDDPTGERMLRRLSHACLLAAYGDEPDYGEEPCTRLFERNDGRMERRACPFARACGRFREFDEALQADVIVVNHHALLAARTPFPVRLGSKPARRVTFMELVLARCPVVLVDEVDGLQAVALNQRAKGLELSSCEGRISWFYRLAAEADRRRGRGGNGPRVQRAREALLQVIGAAEGLTELVDHDMMDWSGARLTWQEGADGWLASVLFGKTEDRFDRLRRLYDDVALPDGPSEQLRQLLRRLRAPTAGLDHDPEETKADLHLVLESWPSVAPADKPRLVDRLTVRGYLMRLDEALAQLRFQLPALEQQEIPEASVIRDGLLGFAPWSPSPAGALGQRLHGYRLDEPTSGRAVLRSQVMAGDPHGLIAELGGVVSESLVGVPRVVLALSATGRFFGAAGADVLAKVWGVVADAERNVQVLPAPVDVRVSGVVDSAKRVEAMKELATQLWQRMLQAHLSTLMRDESCLGRRRVLLVTGSYVEAAAVRQVLERLCPRDVTLRQVVKDEDVNRDDPGGLSRRELESFGLLPEPGVLVAPFSVVARGHNIVQPNGESALSSIFLLTRPVPPVGSAEQMLRHISYNARLFPPAWTGASSTVTDENRAAWNRLRKMQQSQAAFRLMDPELRRELLCDVLVELVQLAGRARRGRTPVSLYLVDGAFEDEVVPWRDLVAELIGWWREQRVFDEMMQYHGAVVVALARYAGLQIDASKELA